MPVDSYRAKGDDKPVGINWHLGFYERHTSIKSTYTRPMEKARVANKDADSYIKWFQLYETTVAKWNIFPTDTHNMDESGCALGLYYKSRVIVPAKEKDAIKSINRKREWGTNINSISEIGKASKAFIITKSKHMLRDLIKPIIELGYTLTVTHNG